VTSTQGCEGKETAPYGIDDLTPRQRRRLLTASVIRSLAAVGLIVTAYFLLPFSRLSNLRLIVEFVAGLLLVMVVFSAQTVATLRTRYPVLRTFEALVVSGPTFLVVFSTTHYLINWQHPGSYSEPMTRLDALYFTSQPSRLWDSATSHRCLSPRES
jgi:voltage-gated potassium channel